MMRNALESPVAEMAGLAAADHRRRDFELSKATQAGQRGDHRRHVTGLIFAQVTGFRARIGDQLLAVAVIQLLRHRKRLVGRPTPTLAVEGLSAQRFAEYLSLGQVPDAAPSGTPPEPAP